MKRGAFALVMIAAGLMSPAEAGLTLCNRTSYVLYAATAAVGFPDATVKGWTRIIPGGCADAIKGDLTAQAYYFYAKTSRAHGGSPKAWSGNTRLCARDKDFSFRGPVSARCEGGAYELGFAEIPTGHAKTWTATVRDTPDYGSLAEAMRAGMKRLLADSGARDLSSDAKFEAALKAFRGRMHLAPNAGDGALFDALETAAMKSANPSGYTLCNDTGSDVYAAVGQEMVSMKGVVMVTRGWWTVASGACAPLITDSVARKKVWLRVEKAKNAVLVQGPAKFCVTNVEFEIQGRDRCAARGLTEAGFAETGGGPAPGFIAHVTAGGLAK